MAHQVLSKDMKELVSAMRLAEKYSTTTLDMEYRKYVSNIKLFTKNNFHSYEKKQSPTLFQRNVICCPCTSNGFKKPLGRG